MSINICKDIESLKKQFYEININKYDKIHNHSENSCTNGSLYELLSFLETLNKDVIENRNLLKSVLEEDQEFKKRCIEKIKNMLNVYVNFYDYVYEKRQYFEELEMDTKEEVLKTIDNILKFLEKEYLNIGLTIYTPNIGIDKLDISKHEVIEKKVNNVLPNNTIICVKKKGFYYNDRNIRYIRSAKVVVAISS
ncbi:nucleotide exchange factor GrpE [Clostridium aciditolerans]|uniref:Nucleotide exchange factor GrpE n=1 Tax=Clostridium aciditolerans TaxID=339861 RepID=A0A934I3F2_9CLOT|nr:nucleotide exchange factor GrpE [Clostridium aciditolerans]MBI6875573.1 nucleotide exchange factor GrpE [Clostridium aciditolerans]